MTLHHQRMAKLIQTYIERRCRKPVSMFYLFFRMECPISAGRTSKLIQTQIEHYRKDKIITFISLFWYNTSLKELAHYTTSSYLLSFVVSWRGSMYTCKTLFTLFLVVSFAQTIDLCLAATTCDIA